MLIDVVPIRLFAPDVTAPKHFRVRVAYDFRFIEAVSVLFVPRSGEAIAVFQLFVIQIENDHAVDVADTKFARELNLGEGLRFPLAKEHQPTFFGRARKNGKVHATRNRCCPEGQRTASPVTDATLFVRVSGIEINALFHCCHHSRCRAHLSLVLVILFVFMKAFRPHERALTASASEPAKVKKFRKPVCDITVRISSETPRSTSWPFLAESSR